MQLDRIHISLSDQQLVGYAEGQVVCRYAVSTALNGAGEAEGSGCTPRGRHRIRARIGEARWRERCRIGARLWLVAILSHLAALAEPSRLPKAATHSTTAS